MEAETSANPSPAKRRILFVAVLIAIVAAAIVRSSIATSLDSFTFDEAYHIGSGATYVQTGDFRLNPEQPPLTKFWSGAYATLKGYKISPFRPFADKSDERDFVEQDAYTNNDPVMLQAEARTAMFALNGLLMFLFALAVWRVLGPVFAAGATLILAIDPTVAAHMPVVMTDLPIALTSGIAIVLAARAFRTWNWFDLLLTGLATGLALSAKHSGIVTLGSIGLVGLAAAIFFSRGETAGTRAKRAAAVAAVVLGSIAVLWAFYGFHYRETPSLAEETFNRPLPDKISDVMSPVYRGGLNVLDRGRLFPRAYVWGLADTIRAGAEGRAIQVRAFGSSYYSRAPLYFFPGIVAAKLPIGLLLLFLLGIGLLIAGRVESETARPLLVILVLTLIYLCTLMTGSTYAGVRHALPLFPLVAIMGAVVFYVAALSRSKILAATAGVLVVLAAASAVPQMRPWEYFNEMAGGAKNGYLYFNDEGVDLSQRVAEMANYYHSELEPNGEIPFIAYFSNSRDIRSRGVDYVGRSRERDDPKFEQPTVTGTFMIGANELGESTWWDVARPFRNIEPTARLGNVFIYKGTFEQPKAMAARRLFYRALDSKVYADEPDIPGAIEMIERSLALDDSCYFVSLELGNLFLKQGDRQKALDAYRRAYDLSPNSDAISVLLAGQINHVEDEPLEILTTIRNPGLE
jgi:hypothetical protein